MPAKRKASASASKKIASRVPAKTVSKRLAAKPAVPKKTTAKRAGVNGARTSPILRTDDIQEIVRDLGWLVAPRDVEVLLAEEDLLRKQAESLTEPRYALLRAQLFLALDILRDHLDGECPQIPLATIAVLGAAVSYYSRTVDVIPDFLPHIGRLDDAAVMAMAFQLGEAGVKRYCDFKGIHPSFVGGPTSQEKRLRRALAALAE